MLSREWRWSWSSADRRCSNYIWVINNLIAYYSVSFIRDLTVISYTILDHARMTLNCIYWAIPYICVISVQSDTFFVCLFNSSPPGQNGWHFSDDIFRCIFMNENICILIKISLKFVPKGPIDNSLALVYRQQAIIWNNADPIHWRIYVTLGGDELTRTKPQLIYPRFLSKLWMPATLSA